MGVLYLVHERRCNERLMEEGLSGVLSECLKERLFQRKQVGLVVQSHREKLCNSCQEVIYSPFEERLADHLPG